jgi:hypothetical protein
MCKREGTKEPATPTTPEQALAKTVTDAVEKVVRPLGGTVMRVSVVVARDEQGRPCGHAMAYCTPRRAQVEDVIDVTPEQVPSAEGGVAEKEG